MVHERIEHLGRANHPRKEKEKAPMSSPGMQQDRREMQMWNTIGWNRKTTNIYARLMDTVQRQAAVPNPVAG